jgi:FkbM family methyltransferase
MSMVARVLKNVVKNVGYAVKRNPLPGWYHKDPYLAQKYLLRDERISTVFDVGANVGQSATEYHKLFPNAQIYCFEPVPETYRKLEQNTRGIRQITGVNCAVNDRLGTVELFVTDAATMNSLLPMCDTSRPSTPIKVPSMTLDCFCESNRLSSVQVLKMDIQGCEKFAVAGAKRILSQHAVDLIYSEVLFSDLYQDQTQFYELYATLAGHGYSLFGLYELRVGEMLEVHHGNAIFISPKICARMKARESAIQAAA